MSYVNDFDSWYRDTRDAVYRSMVATTGRPEVAADLTAEAYVRALERWSDVRRHPAPRAWVLRVALNLHRSRWRRWQRELAHRQRDPGPAHRQESLPFDPALSEFIRKLPRRQREVVAMRIILDLSTAETAEALGIAAGTVTAHLHRALAALRTAVPAAVPAAAREGHERHRP